MFTPRTRNAAVAAVATASLTAALGIFTTGASAEVHEGVAISALSVTKGATTATTNLMITGAGFSKLTNAGVEFGGKPSDKVIVLSDTQIAAVAPTGEGKVNVTLTDTEPGATADDPDVVTDYPALSGTALVEAKDDFTYLTPYPAVITASTLLNSVGGGKLTVTSTADMGASATEFTTTNKVTATVGGVVAPVAWVDKNTATVTVPAGVASNTAPKVVLYHDGVPGAASLDAKYAAVITATDKTGGGLKGGDTVVITGKGLTGATNWMFGTVAGIDCANAIAPAVDTRVTCKVPAAADYSAVAADSTAKAGPVSISFTPAKSAPYGLTAKATWTYSDLV